LELLLTNNQLSKIDLSSNVALEKLYLESNNLTEIDLSNNTQLKTENIKLDAGVTCKGDVCPNLGE
jgi:Leucine-rich repeat (LRR) protein